MEFRCAGRCDGRRRRFGADVVARRGIGAGQDLHHEDIAADVERPELFLRQELRGGAGEGFRRPHQARNLSGEPARRDPAADRGHAIRRHPMRDHSARILRRRRRALRADGGAGPGRFHGSRPAPRRRPGGEEADVRPRRRQGAAWRRDVHERAVLGDRKKRRSVTSPTSRARRYACSPRNFRWCRSSGSARRRWR